MHACMSSDKEARVSEPAPSHITSYTGTDIKVMSPNF